MRHLTIPAIALLLMLVGLYFFPLGEDVVFKMFLDFAGGDYWLGRAYQYLVFGGLILTGFLLLRYSKGAMPLSWIVVALVGLGLLAYIVIRG